MQIEFPTGDLGGFSCADAEVRFSYKYKNLRTALSNIPQKDTTGVNSKVSNDTWKGWVTQEFCVPHQITKLRLIPCSSTWQLVRCSLRLAHPQMTLCHADHQQQHHLT